MEGEWREGERERERANDEFKLSLSEISKCGKTFLRHLCKELSNVNGFEDKFKDHPFQESEFAWGWVHSEAPCHIPHQ